MKRTMAIVLGLVLAVAFAGAATPAQAGTSVSVNLRIGEPYPGGQLVFAHDPDVEMIPDSRVYYIRDSDYDLFRYGKYWYLCDDGVWFRGRTVRGPFLHVGFSTVPRSVVLVPETYRRHWRESPGRGHAYGHYKNQRPEEVVVVKDRGHKGRGRDR